MNQLSETEANSIKERIQDKKDIQSNSAGILKYAIMNLLPLPGVVKLGLDAVCGTIDCVNIIKD